MNQEKFLNNLYNAFDPRKALPAGDPAYVDCRQARGDGDVLVDLGQQILRSQIRAKRMFGNMEEDKRVKPDDVTLTES